jgi:hypothetical protein
MPEFQGPSKFALRCILAALGLSYWHFLEPGTNNSGSDKTKKVLKHQNLATFVIIALLCVAIQVSVL